MSVTDKRADLRRKAMALPLQPGVYLMKDASGHIIYVGKAKKLKNRVSQYFGSDANHSEKVRQMVSIELLDQGFAIILPVILLHSRAASDPEWACCAIFAGSGIANVFCLLVMLWVYRRDCRSFPWRKPWDGWCAAA